MTGERIFVSSQLATYISCKADIKCKIKLQKAFYLSFFFITVPSVNMHIEDYNTSVHGSEVCLKMNK